MARTGRPRSTAHVSDTTAARVKIAKLEELGIKESYVSLAMYMCEKAKKIADDECIYIDCTDEAENGFLRTRIYVELKRHNELYNYTIQKKGLRLIL